MLFGFPPPPLLLLCTDVATAEKRLLPSLCALTISPWRLAQKEGIEASHRRKEEKAVQVEKGDSCGRAMGIFASHISQRRKRRRQQHPTPKTNLRRGRKATPKSAGRDSCERHFYDSSLVAISREAFAPGPYLADHSGYYHGD